MEGSAAGRIESFDLEEHQLALQPWDVRFEQLSRGRFHCWLQYVKTPGMMIYEDYFERGVAVQGATPDGFLMFGTPVSLPGGHVVWCGEEVDARNFACSRSAEAVDFQIAPRTHNLVMLVEPALLARSLGWDVVERLSGRRHLALSDAAHFWRELRRVVWKHANAPRPLASPPEGRRIESELLGLFGRAIERDDPAGPSPDPGSRARIVQRAIEWAEASERRATVLDLAGATGVSRRTLEYAFEQQLGLAPAAFLRAQRLNRARRRLSEVEPRETTVLEVASSFGFEHPGRFSAEYRRTFGEAPSQTLRRSRQTPPLRLRDLLERS